MDRIYVNGYDLSFQEPL